jgi:multidrug efflux pump subunit AcrA (membrane-fusion protein)
MYAEEQSPKDPDFTGAERLTLPAPESDAPPGSAASVIVEHRVSGRRWHWRGPIAIVALLAAIAGVVYWWVQSRIQTATDNAYVVGNITPIAPEVSGTVVALFADDNMLLRAGDPIAQIDPIPFQLQVDQALSDFKQAQYDARGGGQRRLLPPGPEVALGRRGGQAG